MWWSMELKNTSKPARLQRDFDSVSQVFSSLGAITDSAAIVDCCLGQFRVAGATVRLLASIRLFVELLRFLIDRFNSFSSFSSLAL